jgi:hypothetical protein
MKSVEFELLFLAAMPRHLHKTRKRPNELGELHNVDNDGCNALIANRAVAAALLGTKGNSEIAAGQYFHSADHAGNENIDQIRRNPSVVGHTQHHRENTVGPYCLFRNTARLFSQRCAAKTLAGYRWSNFRSLLQAASTTFVSNTIGQLRHGR